MMNLSFFTHNRFLYHSNFVAMFFCISEENTNERSTCADDALG
jgi:hypothetical protein